MSMRIAHFKVGKIIDKSQKQIGISLGCDFCAEHEWGVDGIIEAFGMSPEYKGINKVKIHKFPEQDVIFKLECSPSKNRGILFFQPSITIPNHEKYPSINSFSKLDRDILNETQKESDHFTASWCNNGFCIYTDNLDNCKYLEHLYKEFQNLGVIIGFSPAQNLFRRNCLQFLVLSDMSDSDKEALKSL